MKRTTTAILLLATAALCIAQEPAMITRSYSVVPGVEERIGTISAELGTAGDEADFIAIGTSNLTRERGDWKTFFETMGVPFPEGASIRYVPSIGKIVITNTPENVAKFEEVLADLNVEPSQIEIEAHFVAFENADIETIAMSAPTGIVDQASLFELRRKGKGQLLFAPKFVTQSGAEATVKGVTEHIYPTEFTVEPIVGYASGNTKGSPQPIGLGVEPGGFETREVGIIMTVLPEVSREGSLITLTLAPEAVYDPEWEDFGWTSHGPDGTKTHHQMRQPFFHTQSVSTTVNVYGGKPLVISGGMMDRERTKMIYIFLTARLISPAGEAIRGK
jgi:type II secretory pathway component GspD/PulD (secretin)